MIILYGLDLWTTMSPPPSCTNSMGSPLRRNFSRMGAGSLVKLVSESVCVMSCMIGLP